MRSLEADRVSAYGLGVAVGVIVLVGWAAWMVAADLGVHVVSHQARVEADRAVRPLQVEVEGRVAETALALGQTVQAGQLVLRVDDRALRLRQQEQAAKLTSLRREIEAVRSELGTESESLDKDRARLDARLRELDSERRSAEAELTLKETELSRKEKLKQAGAATSAEVESARAEARQKAEAVETLRLKARRETLEHEQKTRDKRSALDRLRRQLAALEGDVVQTEQGLARVEQDLKRVEVRAPVSGRIGEVGRFEVGSYVTPGTRVATVIPEGDLRVVALLDAAAALGRVKPGMRAEVHLASRPWPEHEHLDATVVAVATEGAGDAHNHIRVELSLPDAAGLEHGLDAEVAIEVERVNPWGLVLRSLGRALEGHGVVGGSAHAHEGH